MTDAFDPAIFALGSDTHLVEQQARQIQAEANAIAARTKNSSAAVGGEQRTSLRIKKDLGWNFREMEQYRRDAALLSENAAMRVDFRATLEDRMRSAVSSVVAPHPPAPSPTSVALVDDANAANADNIAAANYESGGGGSGGDNDEDDLMMITIGGSGSGGGGGITSSSSNHNYPDPLKYIAKRRQELAKRKAAIQSGSGQINATLQRARTADAKDGALKEKMAAENLVQSKVRQDREVESRRRDLEATKRREAGLVEQSRAAHAKYLANGTAIAETVS